jgi:uncharacterized membrane protein YidH (DUF202 family)
VSEHGSRVLEWFKLRAPILSLLLVLLGVVLSMYGRITALEVRQQMMEQQERQIVEQLGRIETRLMVVR